MISELFNFLFDILEKIVEKFVDFEVKDNMIYEQYNIPYRQKNLKS